MQILLSSENLFPLRFIGKILDFSKEVVKKDHILKKFLNAVEEAYMRRKREDIGCGSKCGHWHSKH